MIPWHCMYVFKVIWLSQMNHPKKTKRQPSVKLGAKKESGASFETDVDITEYTDDEDPPPAQERKKLKHEKTIFKSVRGGQTDDDHPPAQERKKPKQEKTIFKSGRGGKTWKPNRSAPVTPVKVTVPIQKSGSTEDSLKVFPPTPSSPETIKAKVDIPKINKSKMSNNKIENENLEMKNVFINTQPQYLEVQEDISIVKTNKLTLSFPLNSLKQSPTRRLTQGQDPFEPTSPVIKRSRPIKSRKIVVEESNREQESIFRSSSRKDTQNLIENNNHPAVYEPSVSLIPKFASRDDMMEV